MQDAIAAERRQLVEFLRGLAPPDWRQESLCVGWSIHHVLGHLVTPFVVTTPRMALKALRAGGVSAAMDRTAAELTTRPPEQLLDLLAANADTTFRPPGLPAAAPLTDVIAHGADIRWALDSGRTDWGEPARLRPVLDFLVSTRARGAFVPRGRLRGLRLVATEPDWSHGSGAEVRGTGLHLAMAVLGRPAAFRLLTGPGALTLPGRAPA